MLSLLFHHGTKGNEKFYEFALGFRCSHEVWRNEYTEDEEVCQVSPTLYTGEVSYDLVKA